MTRTPDLASPSPNFHTTPAGGRRTHVRLRPGAHQPIRVVDAIKITAVTPIPPVEPQRGHVGYYCYILLLNDTKRLVFTGPKRAPHPPNTADLQRNWVSNLKPSGSEADTLHH
ncbi:hypothetical protein AVEN_65298-1 [Araneus ventricosus]|uniref:Uncharacterized protein n=1 Tax=Araneus ventricosus TaxID=182803 RepID=A0A4Y2AGK5_ARAVE|nr:hypothetical protein AVEN_65298-1 [Araneus ventricosus]